MKIAFIGKMFSGKTTAADYLVNQHAFTKLAFADPVKSISADILNLVASRLGQPMTWTYEEIQRRKGEAQVRKLLQLVGTELGRELIGYEDVWVDLLVHDVRGRDNIVIDDCRFPNEAQALKDSGFLIVRMNRPEEDRIALMKEKYPTTYENILHHPSETSLDDFKADLILSASDVQSIYKSVEIIYQANT